VELARRVENLDASLQAMDPAGARAEAGKRRSWAQSARDEGARSEFLEAASRLDEAAGSAEALLRLRERTLAQLDNVAASLESAAVRAVRVRVDGGEGAGEGALQEALRVDVETLRDTLGVFESAEVEAPRRAARGGNS
jgi:erythromycin esterase-like protein